MIDWATVFEHAKPERGASETELVVFIGSLNLPAERPVPPSYLSFLRYSNGGEFSNGKRLFQMYGTNVRTLALDPLVFTHMPQAVPFAVNGGTVTYAFDMRERPGADEGVLLNR